MNDCKQWQQAQTHFYGPLSAPRSVCGRRRAAHLWLLLIALTLAGCGQDNAAPTQTDTQTDTQTTTHTTAQTANVMPHDDSVRLQAATAATDKRRLTDFALVDHHDQPFNRARMLGQWSLVFFGFTRCPDICPPTLTQLSAIVKRLPQGAATPVRIVFISVDPTVDTPAVMARYVQSYNDRMTNTPAGQKDNTEFITGVTGDERQIKGLAAQLGVHYSINAAHAHHQHGDANTAANSAEPEKSEAQSADPNQTQVDHSGTVLLLDPDAYLHALFTPPLPDAQAMMADIVTLTGQSVEANAP